MRRALEKRPVGNDDIDAALARIGHKLRALGEREVPSRLVGELVMDELRHLDEVAYVRFASVYRSFQDVQAFHDEIAKLKRKPEKTIRREQLSFLEGSEAKKGVP